MKQYADAGIRTLQNALFDHMNSDDLKKLGALTKQKLPSRKGDLVDVITRHLEGDGLQTAWRGLDELQRAAVAEVVHSEERISRRIFFEPSTAAIPCGSPMRRTAITGNLPRCVFSSTKGSCRTT